MPRDLTVATLWTAAWEESKNERGCPGEHMLSDRPDVHYVITRSLDETMAATYLAEQGIVLEPGQVVGGVPERMSADGHILSEELTDDERATMFGGMAILAREEIVRVLHRGEHAIPGPIDHDYWICHPVDGSPVVIRSQYTDGGAFVGSEVIPPPRHDLYLRDAEAKWTAGVPYEDWIVAHADLARTPVA